MHHVQVALLIVFFSWTALLSLWSCLPLDNGMPAACRQPTVTRLTGRLTCRGRPQ